MSKAKSVSVSLRKEDLKILARVLKKKKLTRSAFFRLAIKEAGEEIYENRIKSLELWIECQKQDHLLTPERSGG